MSTEKYASIFLHQMEAIVYIISHYPHWKEWILNNVRNFVERERAAKKEKLGGWGGEFIPIFRHLCISTFQRLCNLQADPFSYKTHLPVLPGSSTHGFRIYLLVFPPLQHYLFLIRIFSFVFTCITVIIILLIYFFA